MVREECDGMRRGHQRAPFTSDDARAVRFATTVDADSTNDLAPVDDVRRELRG